MQTSQTTGQFLTITSFFAQSTQIVVMYTTIYEALISVTFLLFSVSKTGGGHTCMHTEDM